MTSTQPIDNRECGPDSHSIAMQCQRSATLTAKKFIVASVLCAGVLFGHSASAKDYLVEIILVENIRGANTTVNPSLYLPRLKNAIGLNGDKAAELGFELVEDQYAMTEYADKLKASGNYRLLKHFAWRQPGLDNESARAIRVNVGRGLALYIPEQYQQYDSFIPASTGPTFEDGARKLSTTTVAGTIKVRLGRFLHLDTRLVFTDADSRHSYRLEHSRKMRSRELHYIDNPKFGLLARIVPIEEDL